jgi:hypothetical protein
VTAKHLGSRALSVLPGNYRWCRDCGDWHIRTEPIAPLGFSFLEWIWALSGAVLLVIAGWAFLVAFILAFG